MLRNTELNVDAKIITWHLRRISPIHPLKNQSFWKSPGLLRNADDVSIVTTASAPIFEPALFIRHEHGTYRLVAVIPVHISIISTAFETITEMAHKCGLVTLWITGQSKLS